MRMFIAGLIILLFGVSTFAVDHAEFGHHHDAHTSVSREHSDVTQTDQQSHDHDHRHCLSQCAHNIIFHSPVALHIAHEEIRIFGSKAFPIYVGPSLENRTPPPLEA